MFNSMLSPQITICTKQVYELSVVSPLLGVLDVLFRSLVPAFVFCKKRSCQERAIHQEFRHKKQVKFKHRSPGQEEYSFQKNSRWELQVKGSCLCLGSHREATCAGPRASQLALRVSASNRVEPSAPAKVVRMSEREGWGPKRDRCQMSQALEGLGSQGKKHWSGNKDLGNSQGSGLDHVRLEARS